MLIRSLFYFCLLLIFTFLLSTSVSAQETNSCPCENCPGLIEDAVGFREYSINIFNVKNNDLANPTQCVSKVGIQFKHEYVGDLVVELVSPAGQVVQLMGDVSFAAGELGQTDSRTFDISFVGNGMPAIPDNGYENRWNNDQEWTGIGTLNGSYLPFQGELSDFNQGRVNGTWTLRVGDFQLERNDEGELLDFYVEFCDPTGLVCDPCLDPEDTPDCIFRIDAGETTVVPGENFCIPIYAENVAFLQSMVFPISWDPTVLEYTGVDSFEIEFLKESDFGLLGLDGSLLLTYIHDSDPLGLVVADSTPIFQICFRTIGAVGDSSLLSIPDAPIAVNVDGETLLEETINGLVKITVDSTADCVRAIQLCGSVPISVEKSRGPGFDENEAIAICSTDGVEHQSKWYQFDVLESGELGFSIKPKDIARYGFSLYKNACPNDNGAAIDCNTGSEGMAVGISNNPFEDFGEMDAGGTNFLSTINVQAGETYFLLIDNFSANGVGFDLSFAGTAIIGDETLRSIIADPAILNCTNPTIRLDASNSTSGAQYNSLWTTDEGEIDFSTNFLQPTINKGGQFTLTITDKVTGCASIDSVFVATDMVAPLAAANNGGILDCFDPTRTLNNLGSSAGDKFRVQWENTTTQNTNLPESAAVTIEEGGVYELKITNTENGCIATDIVLVTEDFAEPQLTTGDNFISCDQDTADLVASSITPQVGFEWSGGTLNTPLSEAQISVTDTGTFTIKVISNINGCISEEQVIVREERIYPIAEAGDPLTLNCDFPILPLDGSASSQGEEFEYNWSSADGQFVEETNINGLTPEVETGGLYLLSVKNRLNGCESLDFVGIDTSFVPPNIEITTDSLLTCIEPVLIIDASASDSGSIYDFDWFVNDGNILSGAGTYQPAIDKAGNYIFTIRNTENGCSSSELLAISADQVFPIANAGSTQTLNCAQRVVILDGEASSQGASFSFTWSTENGHFLGETNVLTTLVDSAGIYQLSVKNEDNGCTSDTVVNILEDFVVPDLSIPKDSTLTCRIPSINLLATSETPNTNFIWRFIDDGILPSNQIEATMPGKYFVEVTASNGCTNVDSLVLDAEQVLPNIRIQPPETITCEIKEITIISEESEQGDNFEFVWTTSEGQFVNVDQKSAINPLVEAPGIYTLAITNNETGCVAQDSVNVPSSVDNPVVTIANEPSVFSCDNTRIMVLAESNVDNAIYEWKLAAETIVESPQLEATAPGVYSVIVLNPANSCSSRVSVEIQADTLKPLADAGPTQELNCTIGNVTLNAGGSVQGPEFSFLWRTIGNAEISDSIQIEVSEPGLYDLIVVDTSNGCRSIDTVRVTISRDDPIADAGKDTIYCSGVDADILDFTLGGSNTSQGANFVYQWFNELGGRLDTTIYQQVQNAGDFILEVTNLANNCVSIDSVTVFERPNPVVTVSSFGAINCRDNEIRYVAESDIPTSTITWIGNTSIDSALLIVTDALLAENFVAFAEDTLTGCLGKSLTVSIEEDRLPPLLSAGEDTKVNCADTLRLDGQLLSANIEIDISWQTVDGNIVTSRTELNPIVDAAGQYILTLQNINNFCEATDTVIVSTDQELPMVILGEDSILTCNNPELNIIPIEVSEGPNFYYNWKDEDNKIVSTEKNLLVDFPGIYQLQVVDSSNLCTKSDVLMVVDSLNPPEIEIIAPEIITCQNNQVTLNTLINTEEAAYQWTILSDTGSILGANNLDSLLVNAAGIYQIAVINTFSGCSGEKNITVEDIRKGISIEAGEDKIINCNNDTTVLAAGTIFSPVENLIFEWTAGIPNFSPIDSSLLFTIREEGAYFLRVIDTLSFCEAKDTFFVAKDIAPIEFEIGVGDTLNCEKETVILGDINEVNAPYIYQWTTRNGNITAGANQSAAMVNQPGVYQLDIESMVNGCTFRDSLQIIVDRTLPVVDIGSSKGLTCTETEVTLGGDSTDIGSIFTYEWRTDEGSIVSGGSTPFANVSSPGIYQLIVKNVRNQCENSETIEVATEQVYPTVTLPENLSFACTDDFIDIEPSVEIDLLDLSIFWRTDNGLLTSDQTDFLAKVGAPGLYYISVEDTRNNCSTLDSVLVLNDRDLPSIVEIPDQLLGCQEEGLTLDATGSSVGNSIVYEWKDANGNILSNSQLLTTVAPGLYILELTDQSNSCVSQDSIQVIQNENLPVGALINVSDPACIEISNGLIQVTDIIGGVGPFNYLLNDFDNNQEPVFSDLPANTYNLRVIDQLACTWDTTIVLNQPPPIQLSIISEEDDLVTGQTGRFSLSTSISSEEIAEIIWTPSDLIDCPGCESIDAAFINNTTLGVQVIDVNGCEASTTLDVEVELSAVPNGITPNGDGMNDFFMIPILEQQPDAFPNSELIIFNRWGDILFDESPYKNNWEGQNNAGKPIPEGTYYYVLRLDTREGEVIKGDITILR